MAPLTSELIIAALNRLRVCFPNSGHTSETLLIIAEDWFMDFNQARISPEMFSRMVILARRRCKFFPTEADMLEFMKEIKVMDTHKSNILSLPVPEKMSDEESAKGVANVRKIFELAESGKTIDEMEAEMAAFVAGGSIDKTSDVAAD